MSEKKPKKLAFEIALEQLEIVVEQLESKDLPLEKSLELFEQGISLSKTCTQQLGEAEEKVEQLLKQLAKDTDRPAT